MPLKPNRRHGFRQAWLVIHLYLGLSLGSLLAITGITGTLLVFYIELDEWLNPELIIRDTDRPKQALEAVVQALRRAEPNRTKGWRLEIPTDPQRMITARYYKPAETEHAHFAPLLVSVNPYTAEVVKSRFWGQTVMTWLYDLHYTLLLDQTGKLLMAVLGGVLALSLVTGVYLWWPSPGKWRSALTIKPHASPERLTYDLHKVGGVYGFIVVLILALTGIALEIPEYVNPVIAAVSPLHTPPKPASLAGQQRIPVDQAVVLAAARFPEARVCWVETPHDAQGNYRINLRQAFEPSRRFPKTNVWIDQYNGNVLAVSDAATFSAGDTLLAWLHALHSGEAFDLTGRWLVFFAGLACPLLFVTGVLRWLHKRRARYGRLRRTV